MPLDHAILAFIQFSPMSGYDLKKYFDQSVAHFWSATQSHIYKSLERMLERGWLVAEVVPQEGRPDRKVYSITAAGAEELNRWLRTPLPLQPTREDWLIQIFFAYTLSNEEIVALLEARAQEAREMLAHYHSEVQTVIDENHEHIGVERARDLWQMTLDYGIACLEANLAWLEQAIEKARHLPPLTPPLPSGTSPPSGTSRGDV
jgi:PadR family transcriptional regulator, regulatory protein AphA